MFTTPFRGRPSTFVRRQLFAVFITAALLLSLTPLHRYLPFHLEQTAHAAAFTPGNVVIYRVGTGTGALANTATAVFLDEYTPAGTLVQSIPLPTADNSANQTLTASGTATSEGLLSRSTDGRYLVMTGYDAAPGTASITGSASSTINRIIGRVDSAGAVDTTTALTDASTGSNPRSAASTDGTNLWMTGGAGGVRYTTLGATTSTQLSTTTTNLRQVNIFNGQLYVSAASGATRVATVGTGTPTTSGQTITNVPGIDSTNTPSPYAFFFADLDAGVAGDDTLYVADDSAAASGGGIKKYSLVGGTWTARGTITAALAVRGLTGVVSGSNVSLFATGSSGSNGQLFNFTDTTGYNANVTGAATSIATAGTNMAFRGVALAPVSGVPATPTPTPTPTLSINNATQAEGNSGPSTFTFTVSLTSAPATDVTFDIATADGTAQDGVPAGEDTDYVAKTETGRTITAGNTSATFTVTVNGDTVGEANETFFVNVTNIVGAIAGDTQGLGTINNDDVPVRPIFAIQGSNTSSPFDGTAVTTTGIVTGRRSFGGSNNGFYIQDPNGDNDVNTSDAILVFTGSTVPTVNVGDLVQVTGTIDEFEPSDTDEPDGVTPIPDPKTATELVGPLTINVISTGNTPPAALDAPSLNIFNSAALSRGAELEKYEYMRISVPSLTVYQPTNNFGEFWGVVTGQARPFREPGIERGDPVPAADEGPHAGSPPPNVPIFDGNFERIMVNSGSALIQPGTTRRAQVQVTTGTVVTGIVGPLDYAFDNYQIILDYNVTPGTSGGITAAVPVPTPAAGEFTIASANLENFTNNANRLNKASLAIRNVMRTPDVLGVIEVLDQATLTALANKVNADAANPSAVNYQAFLSETSATQDIGFLVNTARVTPVGTPTAQFVGKTFVYAGESDTLHDRPPFILTVDVPQPNTAELLRVTIILNHTKSLIAVDSPRPRGAGGTEGGRNREKRRLQAEDIADLIQARKDENLVMMGDLNAFDFNDGLGDIVGTMKGTPAPPNQVVEPSTDRWTYQLFNSLGLLPADQQYSLLFEGNAQALDHILVNNKMRARQSRFAYARFNADFSEAFADDPNRPERLSDHDAGVSYFTTGATAQPGAVLISEFRFNGPNGTSDEFIELYNNSDSPVNITGWRIVAPAGTGGGGVLTGLSGTMLPRGHYLVGLDNNSVSGYPSADADVFTAVPDRPYNAAAFLDDGGAQLENASGEIIDAVGFNSVNGTNYREGTGLSPATGVSPGAGDQYSFVRKMTNGFPQDTNNNAADFVLVSTTGTVGATVAVLGAPGPENTDSPIQRNAVIKATLIDNCNGIGLPASGCQNRVRDGAASNPTNAQFGTLSFRRKFTNTSQEDVYRLRFRVVDITTLNSPGYAPNNGQADLRLLTSGDATVTPSNPFVPGDVSVEGTTLEQPPTQTLGGGLNSTVTLDLSADPLASGESITVQLLVGVQQNGFYRFFVNVEALSADTVPPPAFKAPQGKNGARRQ